MGGGALPSIACLSDLGGRLTAPVHGQRRDDKGNAALGEVEVGGAGRAHQVGSMRADHGREVGRRDEVDVQEEDVVCAAPPKSSLIPKTDSRAP